MTPEEFETELIKICKKLYLKFPHKQDIEWFTINPESVKVIKNSFDDH